MTYGQYLEQCEDEFERVIIIANLARRYPNYNEYSPQRQARVRRELLNMEMPETEQTEKEKLCRNLTQ